MIALRQWAVPTVTVELAASPGEAKTGSDSPKGVSGDSGGVESLAWACSAR
jgi:hypothetical protein